MAAICSDGLFDVTLTVRVAARSEDAACDAIWDVFHDEDFTVLWSSVREEKAPYDWCPESMKSAVRACEPFANGVCERITREAPPTVRVLEEGEPWLTNGHVAIRFPCALPDYPWKPVDAVDAFVDVFRDSNKKLQLIHGANDVGIDTSDFGSDSHDLDTRYVRLVEAIYPECTWWWTGRRDDAVVAMVEKLTVAVVMPRRK